MDDPQGRLEARSPEFPTAERLESWKEIAAYLKHDVRTLQRWEISEGLPVYRRPGRKRATVFAYKAELDQWWSQRRNHLDLEALAARRRQGRPVWLVAAAAVLVLCLAVAVTLYPGWSREPAGSGEPNQRRIASLRLSSGAVSPDGNWLAYTDIETTYLWIRNLRDGQSRVLVPEHTYPAVAWSGTVTSWPLLLFEDKPTAWKQCRWRPAIALCCGRPRRQFRFPCRKDGQQTAAGFCAL